MTWSNRTRDAESRISCRHALLAALARRVRRNDAPALFWGITQGRVDGLKTILLGAPNRVTELQPWL